MFVGYMSGFACEVAGVEFCDGSVEVVEVECDVHEGKTIGGDFDDLERFDDLALRASQERRS